MNQDQQSEDQPPEPGPAVSGHTEPPVEGTPRPAKAEDAAPARKAMNLAALAEGMPGLTPASGQVLAEAAAICLEHRKHPPGVRLERHGLAQDELKVDWPPVDDQCRRCHGDMQEATERGACGVAILVVREATGMVVIDRAMKGTGVDYRLGMEDDGGLPFVGTSRLEVSGILAGTKAQVHDRIKQKRRQMKPTDHVAPGFVAVVEFGTPLAYVENK